MGYLKGFSCPASSSVDPHPLASYCLLKKTGERVIHPLVAFFFFFFTISVSELWSTRAFCRSSRYNAVLHDTYTYTHKHVPVSQTLHHEGKKEDTKSTIYLIRQEKANQKEISSHLSSSSSLPSPSPSQHSSRKPETSTTIFSADSHVLPTCRISAPLPTFTRVVRMAGFTREPWIRAENATVDLEEGEKA